MNLELLLGVRSADGLPKTPEGAISLQLAGGYPNTSSGMGNSIIVSLPPICRLSRVKLDGTARYGSFPPNTETPIGQRFLELAGTGRDGPVRSSVDWQSKGRRLNSGQTDQPERQGAEARPQHPSGSLARPPARIVSAATHLLWSDAYREAEKACVLGCGKLRPVLSTGLGYG